MGMSKLAGIAALATFASAVPLDKQPQATLRRADGSSLTGDRMLDGSRDFPWSNLLINFLPSSSVYHTTDGVISTVKALQTSCASVMTYKEEGTTNMQVLTFTDPAATGTKTKMFVNFALHGREYITSEVGIAFANKLCDGSDRSKKILASTEIMMVPLANEAGRRKVEVTGGAQASCASQRKNGNNVDLNRNFDFEWPKGSSDANAEDYHGAAPMDQPESQTLNSIISAFGPKIFVDVHSGDTTMMHPYSYKAESCANPEAMTTMLNHVNSVAFADKPVTTGAAALSLHPPYTATGTTLDYFFEKKGIPYAFTFEVWAGQKLRQSKDNARGLSQLNLLSSAVVDESVLFNAVVPIQPVVPLVPTAATRDNGTVAAAPSAAMKDKAASLLETASQTGLSPLELSQNDCFAYFNPTNDADVSSCSDKWSNSLMVMAEYAIANKIQ